MIRSNLNIQGNETKYVVSVMARFHYDKSWKEVYIGINDEGYASWYYPVNTITNAVAYNTFEEAENAWLEDIRDEFVKENPSWEFDLFTAGIRKIKVGKQKRIFPPLSKGETK